MRPIAYLLIACGIVAILAVAFGMSRANADEYPSVREIEQTKHFVPGAQFPVLLPIRGRLWGIYYIRAKATGNGEYDVRVRLR